MSDAGTNEPGTNEPGTSELGHLVDVWWQAIQDFTELVESLPEEAWSLPTDLPGWDVRAVVAHTAHLEALLAGRPHDEVEVGDAPHVKNQMGQVTEQGVVARRDRSTDELVNEIRESATARHTALLADPPTDPDAPADGLFGLVGWSTRTLLRNRPLDLHLHEQDIRRAVDRPGNHDSPAGIHTVDYLSESMGMVLGKRTGAPAGATLRLEVEGHEPRAWRVDDDGRGQVLAPVPDDADVTLSTDRETFLLLAAGRRNDPDVRSRVQVSCDDALAEKVLDHLAVTP